MANTKHANASLAIAKASIRPLTFRAPILAAALALAVGTLAAPSSEAGQRYKRSQGNYVVAESRFGNGRVVGPVRHTSVGRQVKTPGGSWLHCARSCSETLRVNTVDFWENEGSHRGGAIDQEDGVLGRWLHWQRRY